MLGAEHALRQPRGLRSLILSNSLASELMLLDEAHRLRAPTCRRCSTISAALATADDPAYLAATLGHF